MQVLVSTYDATGQNIIKEAISRKPQPYEDDFELEKIEWDREKLKDKSGHELHEEKHYEKFKYYLEH